MATTREPNRGRRVGPKKRSACRQVFPELNALLDAKLRDGQYFGELTAQMEYKNKRGTLFGELYVDQETLIDRALTAGWDCDIVIQQENGRYLARLTPLQY